MTKTRITQAVHAEIAAVAATVAARLAENDFDAALDNTADELRRYHTPLHGALADFVDDVNRMMVREIMALADAA